MTKKQKVLSACLSISLLMNTVNCFCVSKNNKEAQPKSTETSKISKIISKKKIKKIITSEPVKKIGGTGAVLLGAVGIYEGACHIGYKINVKKIKDKMSKLLIADNDGTNKINICDLTSEKIAALSFENRKAIFEQCFSVVFHDNDIRNCLGVSFYTLVYGAETILCRSAKKRLQAHEKRIIGLKGGNCLDFAFFASLLFDKLGIKNHIVCVKHKCNQRGFVNIFFDEDQQKWMYFARFDGSSVGECFYEIKNPKSKVVLEPLKNWDDKYLVDLKTIPLEDFPINSENSEIKFNNRLGDFTPTLFFI